MARTGVKSRNQGLSFGRTEGVMTIVKQDGVPGFADFRAFLIVLKILVVLVGLDVIQAFGGQQLAEDSPGIAAVNCGGIVREKLRKLKAQGFACLWLRRADIEV